MRIGLIGMNYKRVDLKLREHFARSAKKLSLQVPSVILSTCNRTEIYFSAEDLTQGHSEIVAALKEEMGEFGDYNLYSCFAENCFAHLAHVITGLDSVIFGEAEIQRQVKEAYEHSCQLRDLPAPLHFLFQKSLKVGKEVRTLFSLPRGNVSMESIVADIVRYFFRTDKTPSFLFVGFSEINRKIFSYLQEKGFSSLHLTTRNPQAVQQLPMKNFLVDWLSLSYWFRYDIVVCGSQSSDYLLRYDHLNNQEIQTKLVLDVSMPRNADPLIGKHPCLTLLNIEEINGFISHKQQNFGKEKKLIYKHIEDLVSRQVELYHKKKSKVFECA
jgi:glutamyl-tRNA reductase